jgi:hypothetical protein
LQIDVWKTEMRAVFFRVRECKERRIISYASVKFSPAEQRYHNNEQECLAVVWAVKKYLPVFEYQPFTLRTDNTAFASMDTFCDVKGKLARRLMQLHDF